MEEVDKRFEILSPKDFEEDYLVNFVFGEEVKLFSVTFIALI